jgi:hypothetical protein
MRATAGQVGGITTLSMHRIGRDHRSGDVYAVQQEREHRDLVRPRADLHLAQDGTVNMIEGSQQVIAGFPPLAEPRKVLPSTAMTRRCPGPGRVACCAQAPARSSKVSASRRCRVRRNVDSEGTAPLTPSTWSVCPSASAAHPAMAVNDRAPATTAHNARPKIPASRWRTPRRCRGSATLASTPGNPGCSPLAPAAS